MLESKTNAFSSHIDPQLSVLDCLNDLIEAGRFDEALLTIQELQANSKVLGRTASNDMLRLAQEICKLCIEYEDDLTFHRSNLNKVATKQEELKQNLQRTLGQMNGRSLEAFLSLPTQTIWKQSAEKQELSPSIEKIEENDGRTSVQPTTPALTFYCLGSFQVFVNDIPITQWASGKGKSVLQFLLLHHPAPVSKEVLMAQFWPDSDADAARNNLNVAIYSLRRSLRQGDEDVAHVVYEQDAYSLNPRLHIWCDVIAFESAYNKATRLLREKKRSEAVAAMHTAVTIYQGEFMTDEPYEAWLLPLRQQLQDNYLELLLKLAQFHFDAENLPTCLDICKRIIQVEPCHEATHRRMMELYTLLDQKHMALRHYHRCVDLLQTELDVEPEEATTSLFKQIRSNS